MALRQEIETWLAPELLALHALLLGVDGETLGRLVEWLDRVQTPFLRTRSFSRRWGGGWTLTVSGCWRRTL